MTISPASSADEEILQDDASTADESALDIDDGDVAVWARFGDSSLALPSLPRMPAVNRAMRAGVDFGLPEGFATALAHAAVDPSELRSLLNRPTRVNIAGGVIEAIDLDVYVPGVVPLPTNNRTMEQRVYPAAGAAGHPGPLTGPRSEAGRTSTLVIEGNDVTHVLEEVQRSQEYILVRNNLRESIAARGIAMPVSVVYFELRHRDGQTSIPLLGTADGSSRVTNAHDVLGLPNPQTTHYHYPTNRDDYRRDIGAVSAADPNAVRPAGLRRLMRQRNALITPARVFLRFTPTGVDYDYARAVNAFVGMLHVDPPRPWSQTGKSEAMAESVLEVLRSNRIVDDTVHDYLAGLLTPAKVADAGLPVKRDEQAAFVLSTLLRARHQDMVDRGIRDVTAKKSVSPGRRADVVAELALRPTRSAATMLPGDDPERERAQRMRAAYLRSCRLGGYAETPWTVSGREPDELLDAALAELARPDAESSALAFVHRLELAALAQYHLTAWGALRREAMGDPDADKRGPHQILHAMIRDEQGLRLLHQALRDGRAGRPPRRVTASGEYELGTVDEVGHSHEDPTGESLQITDFWLRQQAFPTGLPLPPPVVPPPNESPRMRVARLKARITELVDQTTAHVKELADVTAAGGPTSLIDQDGWSEPGAVLRQLMDAFSSISYWSQVSERRTARPREDDETDDDTEDL